MSHVYPLEAREVLNQIVSDPRFRKLNTAPTFGLQVMSFVLLGFTVFLGSLWAYFEGMLPYALFIPINGYSMIIMFTGIHEATHRSVSEIDWLNDAIGTIGAFLYMPGMSTTLYRYLHLDHHRYTGDPKRDPDVQYTNAPFLVCVSRWFIKDILWGIWIVKHFEQLSLEEKRAFFFGSIVYVTWYASWLLSPYATEFVLLYLIPQRIYYCVLLYFFAYVQHPVGVLQSEQPFQATVLLNAPKWAHPLIMFQDKHIIHHMFPKLPFYRYPRVWAFAQKLMESQNVPRRNIVEWNWQPEIKPLAAESKIKVNIAQITDIAKGVKSYQFIPLEGKTLPSFTAGAHIDVYIKPNVVRQYSLCNAPNEKNNYVIAVKCDEQGRGGSQALHQLFSQGQQIEISTPRNHFELDESANNYHLVAGGIGLTPMLAMAYQLHQQNKTFTLHLFARSIEFLPFADTLKSLPFYKNITVYFDSDIPLPKRDISALIGEASDDKELYLCGPQPFMDFFIHQAQQANWLDENIKFEAFSAVPFDKNNNKAFELKLLKSNKTIQVLANESIVQAMEKANIHITVSCGQGTCGTCVCKVSKGEVDHRDAILTKEQQGTENKMALCVSRAKGQHLSIEF